MNVSNNTKIQHIEFFTSFVTMKERIQELHDEGWFIESINPTAEGRVQIVAKPLKAGMLEQTYRDLDIKGLFNKIILDDTVKEKKNNTKD